MSNHFLSKVSFVNKISLIMKATSDDEKPIPGYLYKEISDISNESGENCESLLEFLVDRLERDSTHVKLKVLKVMRNVVENGHPNFRLGLLKKSTGIREAVKYSGPPDPLHGNVPYVMVRKTAQGLSEILFNTDQGVQDLPSSVPQHINTVGIGSNQTDSRSVAPRMEGFGNTYSTHSNKTIGENIKDGIFKVAEMLGETSIDHQRELLSTLEGSTDYRPPMDTSFGSVQHFTQVVQPTAKIPKHVSPPRHIPGRAGGGWEDSDDEDTAPGLQQQHYTSRTTGSDSVGTATYRLESTVLEDYSSEQTVISSYIDNTDALLLKRSQMNNFLKDCNSLNCDKIVEFLNVQLSSSSSTVVMKSLMLLEAIMMSDLVNLDRLTSVCRDGLVSVYHGHTGSQKSKARKLIRILEKLTSQHSILPLDIQNTQIVQTDS